jgi:hypothetical protein
MDVYLEIGRRRVFASAIDWPGLARAGRHEEGAMAALVLYARRYVRDLTEAAAALDPPEDAADLRVVERLPGDATCAGYPPGG